MIHLCRDRRLGAGIDKLPDGVFTSHNHNPFTSLVTLPNARRYVLGSCPQRRCPRLSMHHSSVVPRLPAYITHPGSDSASSLHLKPPQRQPAQHAGWPNRCNRDPAAVDMAARNTARVDLECKLVPRRLWAGPTVRESLKSPTSSLVRAASIWTFFFTFPSFHLEDFRSGLRSALALVLVRATCTLLLLVR